MDRYMAQLNVLIVAVVLLAASASAQIPHSLDSLELYVLEGLSLPSTGGNNTTLAKVRHSLGRANHQVSEDFPAIEKLDTLFVYKDSIGARLPADLRSIVAAYRIIGVTKRIPLAPRTPAEIIVEQGTTPAATHDETSDFSPRYYKTHGDWFKTYPKWSRDDSMAVELEYLANDEWMVDGTTDSVLTESTYRNAIIVWALADLWAQRGRLDKSKFYLEWYDRFLARRPITNETEGKP